MYLRTVSFVQQGNFLNVVRNQTLNRKYSPEDYSKKDQKFIKTIYQEDN